MMLSQVTTLLLCFALQTVAFPRTQSLLRTTDEDDGCPTGVHIVGIRGTTEAPGFGAMDKLVEKLLKEVPDSDSIAIDYPAAGITVGDDGKINLQPLQYISSVQKGRAQLAYELQDFNLYCPNSSVVVMGYSQGAHVSGDVLCGSTFPFFPQWQALDPEYKTNIKAHITLGDPRNNATTPKHVGNSTKDGIFVRSQHTDCGEGILNSWKTYCYDNDTFCDHGKSIDAHLTYVNDYLDDIVSFIKSKLKVKSNCHERYGMNSCEL